ncbi:protein VACUOLELESS GAMETOPHYTES [Setaria viridis]|uniref:protein VACUOLELESS GAMETOPHYTES n=1 Tax=Setaria viridis TaxID=4556 RepID=UPI003B3A0585
MAARSVAHFAHPAHELNLTSYTLPRWCDLCGDRISTGTGYSCRPCDFDVHEDCAKYRETLCCFFAHPWHDLTLSPAPPPPPRSDLHPGHALTAVPAVGTCAACRRPCYVWVYRCGPCKVDLHITCVQGARPSCGSSDAGAIAGDGAGDQHGARKDKGSLRAAIESRLQEMTVETIISGAETIITTLIENL